MPIKRERGTYHKCIQWQQHKEKIRSLGPYGQQDAMIGGVEEQTKAVVEAEKPGEGEAKHPVTS